MFATYSDLAGESKVVVLKEFHQAIAWLDVPETVVHAALAELRAQTEDARGK